MKSVALYPSKPLDCWARLMELRRNMVRGTYTAHERGELVAMWAGTLMSLPAGLGKFHVLPIMPIGPDMKDNPGVIRMNEAADTLGFGSDCCATLRPTLGAMVADRYALNIKTGKVTEPDFECHVVRCQGQTKTCQVHAQHWPHKVPTFLIEVPSGREEITEGDRDFIVAQMHEAIEWFEKVTKRTYDDEKLAHAWLNEWQSRVYLGKIMKLTATVPAPIDQPMAGSLANLLYRGAHHDEVVQFLEMALGEIEDRARNGIAALATERCRLMHEGPSPWFSSQVLRYPKQYGAVYVGSRLFFAGCGGVIMKEDNSLDVAPGPKESNINFKSRDDILRSIVNMPFIRYPPFLMGRSVEQVVKLAQDWHVDGVVYAVDRGCRGNAFGTRESILSIKKAGIACMDYDTACGNPAEFSEGEYRGRFDALMEKLGLKVLADTGTRKEADAHDDIA